jgi:acyl-CoA reductase-like NAD-dependent aldehyde dehydrogenase
MCHNEVLAPTKLQEDDMSVESPLAVKNHSASPKVREWLERHQPALFINNKFVPARSGKTFEAINPTNEEVLALAAEGDKADVDDAVRAARTALESGPWSRMGAPDRARLLRRFADLIIENTDELAELEVLNNGTPIGTAKALMPLAAESLHFFAGSAINISGHTMPTGPGSFNYTLREPVGVCGSIIPWNAPVVAAIWKIGPALAAGNTLILKPAEQTPLTAMRLAELAVEAGLPEGVLNVITGYGPGAGSSIAEHPGIDKVSFTGSGEVGKTILRASAGNLKRVTLELGGKSPNIVFPDADFDRAVMGSVAAFSFVSGQVCAAGTRLFVQRDIKDEFVDQLTTYTAGIKVGDPLDPATTMGPLSSREQFDRVQGYLDVGKSEGATVRTGGDMMTGPGYFVQPTIFDDVENSMRIAREEIFGPVVSVIPFTDEYDAVLQGNDTSYGLAAAVWTRDVNRAHSVARTLKAGTVWINTYLELDPSMPFGGYKESGLGRELGLDWYHQYTEEKAVFLKY